MATQLKWRKRGKALFSAADESDLNRLTARSRFRHRQLRNWCKAIGIFAVVTVLLAVLLPWLWLELLGDIGVGIVLWHLLFHIWPKEPVRIRCNHCKKLIETNIPWICGFKQCRNENVDQYPFVHRCEHCGGEPKAYQCHHKGCGKFIFLTKDESEQNFARCTRPFKERSDLDIPGLELHLKSRELELNIEQVDKRQAALNREPKPDPYDEDNRRRANEREELEHQLDLIKRRATNAQVEANTRGLEDLNLPEQEKADKNYKRKMERFVIADAGRAVVTKLYPEGSLNYKRGMAVWQEYEEKGTIPR